MANNSPTLVMASLSDDQLKKSIDSLVTHVDEAMKKMVQSTNNAVGEMEAKLKSLGNLKIDTGGSADGGTGRRTQQHEKLTKAVNDASEAVSKETQKLQDLQQSLSGASDREQNFISQKERAANTISKENELLQRQEQELANLKSQQSSFVGTNQQTTASIDKQRESVANLKNEVKYWQSIVSQMQSGDKKLRFNSLWLGDTTSKQGHDILDVANKLYSIMQKLGMETEKGSASTSQAVRAAEELAKYYKISREEAEKLILSVQESPLARGKYTTHYDTRFGLDNLTMQQKTIDDFALRKELAQGKLTFETDNLTLANKRLEESEKAVASASSQRSQLDSQIAAKEKEIAETKVRITAATKEQSEAEKNASQAAKEKANIQSQVANQEKQVAEAKKQLTTATQQQAEVEKQSVQNVAQQTAARDKQIKKNQDVATSFDQMAKAQQVAIRSASPSGIRNADTLQTMNIQLDLLRERLREARQQYSSFVALAAHATTTGDKGLFQYATDGVHRYEQEVRSLIPQIRTLQSGIQQMGDVIAPQGHTIQNYVNSLQKANPELAALNAQYKSGTSLLQDQSTSYASATQSAQRYTEEIRKQAAAIRATKEWQEKGHVVVGDVNYYDKERANVSKRDRQLLLSLEEQIVQAQQKESQEALVAAEANRQKAQAAKEAANTIKSISYKTDLQMNLAGFGVKNVKDVTDEQVKQYQSLEEQLQKLKTSYASMSEEAKKSEQGLGISKSIFELQRQRTELLQSIAQQMSKKQTSAATDQFSSLRQSISSVLGVQSENVHLFDAEKASSEQLSKELKMLQLAYSKLSASRIAKGDGTDIANEIQRVQRALQKLQVTQTRPTSLKSVMGLDEKTLDDIAYKMRQLASYRSGLNVDTQKKEITQVNDEYNRLKKRMDEVMQKNQQMIASNTALGRSWNYMKNRLAFYFTVGASTQFIKNLIEVRSQYEMNERALGILVNSAERGTQIFNELSQMALVSPYTLIELSAAAKQLTAYDVAAKDVVDTTRRLADMAAAVGIPIERLTYALGQIKAYGYLNSRDNRMFANAGIPLVKQLSDYYTELEGRLVSTADVYDRIKKKQVGYEEVMNVISRMTDEGGKFYDFQAKMAETLKVQLANLTLAWNNMLNAMGEESQGVLVAGIGTLKQVFLHWKDIEHILTELVVTLGAYKAYQLVTTRLMGATSASLDAQILAMKRNNAAMLEKQSLTRKLTYDEAKLIATQNQVTAADYRNALSGKQLTKQKALLLAAIYKNNVQLKAALVNMGLLTTAEAASITRGKALAIVFKSIGISIRNAALAIKSFMMSNWLMFAIAGVYELVHAYTSANEHIEEINKQAAEHAKEAFDNIKQYLESESTINTRQRVVYKEGNPLTDAESQKAWDEMREKIELSSSASNTFIAKLMQINDINSRLAAGFDYLRDVQRVAGVMQTLEEDAVVVSSTTLGGLFGEGLKDDLTDFINAYQKYVSLNEDLRQSGVGEEYFNDQKRALEEFRGEVEKTTTSLYNIASREGFNTNEQREFFEREISEIAQAEQMGAKETRIFRMQAEKEYYAYARAQLVAQLEYQQGAQKAATEKRIKDLDNEFGTNKALQESFFTWLTEKQDHAVKNMLRGKTQEEIKQGEWLKDSNAKWVEEMARKFSKEYGVSFDVLRKLVMNANTWSINIPVFFQTIGQPLSDVQRDYEARTGKKFSSNPIIKDAKTQVDIIDTLKKKQKEVANEMETARKAGGKYWEDNKQRYKEENDALVADIHAYNALTDAEEKANKKRGKGGSKKDPLLDALKQEISLVEKLQSDYDKLSKSGASQSDALDTIRGAYGKTIRLLNAQLGKYGLPQLDISQLITGKDPNKTLAHFKQTLDTLVSKGMLTLERSKELEAVFEKFTLSAKTYNLDMITKGLNNELGKLKDEYELAVELDADPELGNAFADMMGINVESLPHTVKEYADRYSTYLNKYLKGKNSSLQFTGDELRGLTRDDITAFREQVDAGSFNQEWFDEILKAYNDISGKRKKDLEETEKWKNGLIEKYGNLQDKLTKIYKDSVQNQINAVKTFGTEDQKSEIVRLQLRLEATDDPAELANINLQIAEIVKDVTDKNPIALKVVTSSKNQEEIDTSKAYWEDFKNSELYAMTFEDMANNSTRAIQLIMDKLELLKDKVKEDPASMKALIKSLEDAQKELNARDPFGGVARSLRDMANASQEAKTAQEALWRAEVDVEQAQQEVDNSEDGTPEEQATAQQKLADAVQRRAAAQVKLTQAENKGKKAQENLKSSLQGITGELDNVKSLFSTVSSLFRAGGDDETADAIDAISEGFSIMTTVIMGVVAAMALLKLSQPELLAIAAALGVIVGLVKFLSGNDNEKIDNAVKESERAVKRLEIAYKDLEDAVNNAYGASTSGAKRAALANKQLQLAEIKRQIQLEKSRDAKDRDEDRILDLQAQYRDLLLEIKNGVSDIVNEMLGISSVGDGITSIVEAMIDAFRNGEDAMDAFGKKWDEMIDNMILKLIVSQYMQKAWDNVMKTLNEKEEEFLAKSAQDKADAESELTKYNLIGDRKQQVAAYAESVGGFWEGQAVFAYDSAYDEWAKKYDEYINSLNEKIDSANTAAEKSSEEYLKWSLDYMMGEGRDYMTGVGQNLADALGEWYTFGQDKDKNLSALQQGISQISETTANALEAYMNSVNQQVYYHSSLLEQIRDSVVGLDLDVSLGVQSQMLLQLQSSYQTQQAIQQILEGVLVPSGRAFAVELLS